MTAPNSAPGVGEAELRSPREAIAWLIDDGAFRGEGDLTWAARERRRIGALIKADTILTLFPLGDQPTDLGAFRASPSIPTERQDGPWVGWQTVPVEPTNEMFLAAEAVGLDPDTHHETIIARIYEAMLSAAPSASPSPEGGR